MEPVAHRNDDRGSGSSGDELSGLVARVAGCREVLP